MKDRALINKLKRRKKFLNRNRGFRQQDKIDLKDEKLAGSPRAFDVMQHVKRRLERSFGPGMLPMPDGVSNDLLVLCELEAQAADPGSPLVPAVAAAFSGQVAGMTTDIDLEADEAGAAGNGIVLVGDGASTIAELVDAWNLANPANTLSVTGGDDTQIPDAAEEIQLAGGSDEVPEVPATDASTLMTLSAEVAAHAGLQPGDTVELLNGEGKGKQLKVLAVDEEEITLEDIGLSAPETDAVVKLQLFQPKKSYV